MNTPKPKNKEKKKDFISRCVSDLTCSVEFETQDQRLTACYRQFEEAKAQALALVTFGNEEFIVFGKSDWEDEDLGFEEDLTDENFYIPEESDYATSEELETDQSDFVQIEAAGLWENIRKKKKRQGKSYKPAKPGEKDRPSPEAWKKAQGAEYQGKKVTLNRPFRTPGGPKKFAVYVKNESGNVVIVRFGDPNMKIKKNIPARRKSFRARHNCSNPGPKYKARYWACKSW